MTSLFAKLLAYSRCLEAAFNAVRWSLLMGSFEQIWESSRHNCWSFAYPLVMLCGIAVLVGVSFIRHTLRRRVANILAVIFLSFVAAEVSSWETTEKWRIRSDWASKNTAQMTEIHRAALIADGANLALGPVVSGMQAFLIFCGVLVVIRWSSGLHTGQCPQVSRSETHSSPPALGD
ncbi:hypothetical protein [Schlesneria paludicola]|uniref:hypothetical protein n=1 Tax=Schlesneria paludicola TaxID=360056 RepID=UPI0012F8031A|nr:hypothetical protein [Schlesneria paludicola]